MFVYQPQESRAGEFIGRGIIAQGEADAIRNERKFQNIMNMTGAAADAAKKVAAFAMGGPAGAAMASGGGAGGGDGGGGLLSAFTQYFGAKKDSKTIDKMAGMARDEGLMTQDTLEKFINLPWQEKAPVFDLWRQTMMPIQANRMKVQDQAQIWSDYRGGGGGMPASAAANRYGYVYQGP